jgi:hypothetical protein
MAAVSKTDGEISAVLEAVPADGAHAVQNKSPASRLALLNVVFKGMVFSVPSAINLGLY